MSEQPELSEFPNLKGVVPDISLDDLDELLGKLTAEELDELNGDFDPDNSLLPPSDRMKNQTDKSATGPFSRQKLLKWLEEKAKNEKDWELIKPYVGEKRAVLGFHSMLTQQQYYASLETEEISGQFGGFKGVAKAQELKLMPNEPENKTDVVESLQKLKDNDSSLKHLNLNNIKNISLERLCEFCEALKTNTQLETLEMASTAATDKVAKTLAKALEDNKTLKNLNIESNFISGEAILEIMKAINKNMTVIEFRITNQKPEVLGNKVEMQLTKLVEENPTILRFGIACEFPDARVRIHEKIQENNDELRKKRVGKS
ncbi:TMOD [Mytilus edulis]|uniref:TMOD n=1 Tax=Mytilus edulis TaxID=6550 RepID=A0A8S3QS36_MYTED|nr:TMOD [Mytilus edulis]